MKPISIRFKCFGPYMQEQFIDFTQLESARLFLICGETGSGKTTILDAMCYALYNKSSGGLRGELSVMRCKLADKDDETLVEFVFDSNGRRYKFVRSMHMSRKNMNESHNCLELIDGEYVPIFENPQKGRVSAKAEEIIGLTYDQFRQVIILPQGQFEKLLVSDSKEKEAILVSLFHAERWNRIVEEINRRMTEKANELKQEKIQIDVKLCEYGCASVSAMEEKITEDTLAAEEIKTRAAEAGKNSAELRKQYEQALVEIQQFEELAKREADLKVLLTQEEDILEEEKILEQAESAEAMQPQFTAYESVKERRSQTERTFQKAEQTRTEAEDSLAAAQKKRSDHEASRPIYEQNKTRITRLEDARELYRSLTEKKEAAGSAEAALAAAQKKHETAESVFAAKDAAWQAAQTVQAEAIAAYQKAQSIYLLGIGGTLAEKLENGQPCPVCGSREHPAPAAKSAEHISDTKLEELNRAQQSAGEAVSKAFNIRAEAEKDKNNAHAAMNEAAQKAALAKAEYESALTRKIDGLDTEAELEAEIRSLRQQAETFEKAEADTAKAISGAEKNMELARAEAARLTKERDAAREEFQRQETAWQKMLEESVFEDEAAFEAASMEPEERKNRRAAAVQYRADLKAAQNAADAMRETLSGREAPDVEGRKTNLDEAEAALNELNKQTVLVQDRLEKLRADHADLTERKAKYDAAMRIFEEDNAFATRLKGSHGVGLQRYVLGVMLTSITAAANLLLKNVYGGRYQLYRTNEIAGRTHSAGLELEVYDASNNERRSVTTLSGGEKFLMALGLAIGLSTVVQAQGSGIRLEAMFIDEGFGSLDKVSARDALDVLQSVTAGSGIVGIISHVEQLAETLNTKIVITKGKNGSTCHVGT